MVRAFMQTLPTALLAAFVLSSPAIALPHSSTATAGPALLRTALQRDLDAYLKDRCPKEHCSALSLSVSLGRGTPDINLARGTTQYGSGPRVTPASLYQIGSNTKSFTAVAVLQLEAQGRLSIDAPIGNYLPQYPAFRNLTLRRLLSMTGGLESYDNTQAWLRSYANDPMADVPSDTLIRMVYPKIKFTPGTRYYYSNTGYLLAQEVVAARSLSKSYDAEIARIISSVGLKNTFYASHLYPAPIARRVVSGYYENNDPGFGKFIGKDMTPYSLSWAQGAGAIVSTPEDLVAWARAMYQGTALLPAKQKRELMSLVSVKTARRINVPTPADPAGFGLGVAQRNDPGFGPYWFYQGETLGFRAAHLYFPDSDLVVTLFANSRPIESNSDLHKLFLKIYATIKARPKS
ncbi:MAG: serine hydrolase domain-containing protein [Candidatus Eremiobacter antarcticus]|nr:beta-lactamase family protein [Candidatus Eremiobacteraeota bacterium]